MCCYVIITRQVHYCVAISAFSTKLCIHDVYCAYAIMSGFADSVTHFCYCNNVIRPTVICFIFIQKLFSDDLRK